MNTVKSIAKKVLGQTVYQKMKRIKNLCCKYYYNSQQKKPYKQQQKQYRKILKKVKKKEKIKVAFFLLRESMWKLDKVFQLMLKDEKIDPIVVVCPYIDYGDEQMLAEMNRTFDCFTAKGYATVCTYNEKTGEWLDVKKTINPDIVFFTNPYESSTRNEYYITNYTDRLTCYVPYGLMSVNLQQIQFNQMFHNLCWKIFCETQVHAELSKKYAISRGVNVVYTGYPMFDDLLNVCAQKNPWKKQDSAKKRIIWAPHHTIESNETGSVWSTYSCFLIIHNFMLETAEKYNDTIQIAFKPHPTLKSKLYNHPDWGKSRTDAYYKKWENLSNGQIEEGEYIDLFLTSDAMILDSISFIAEYMVTQKPSLFTIRDCSIYSRFNEFGMLCFNLLYHADQLEKDIICFIENTVNGVDNMKNERIDFTRKYLIPSGNKTASENMYEYLKNAIKKGMP